MSQPDSTTLNIETKHIGKFNIKKIKKCGSPSVLQELLTLIHKIIDIINEEIKFSRTESLLPIHSLALKYEFNTTGKLIKASINDERTFSSLFSEYIERIKQLEDCISINFSNVENEKLLNTLFNIPELKRNVMLYYGGSMSSMFPPCVGYVYESKNETLMIEESEIVNYVKSLGLFT